MRQYRIVMLGAAYGLLPAMRLSLAGHSVTIVCREAEQEALVDQGAALSFLRRDGSLDQRLMVPAIRSESDGSALGVVGPDVAVDNFDLAFLVMAEPQYAAPEIAALLARIAERRLPVVSLMNAPPPPFLRRLVRLDVDALRSAYSAWDAWSQLDPDRLTASSPDAQAVRTNRAKTNELSVTLGSNFKIAPFARAEDQAMLEAIADSVAVYRRDGAPLPVRLLAHHDLHVPLAKWPMLIAGNCRCLQEDGSIIPIRDAVLGDEAESEGIYNSVLDIVRAAGAEIDALVPYRFYARAAKGLTRPSTFACAVAAHAPAVERVDKLVQLAGRSLGIEIPQLDAIVAQADALIGRHT